MDKPPRPELPPAPTMRDFQAYVHALEAWHGWLEVDLVHNCFLMGEEVGELFKAVRRHLKYYEAAESPAAADTRAHVAEELVDVFNYLAAIANRLDIDLEAAFRDKNTRNLDRTWG
ncbi:MAG: hypothetical protein KC620_04805 [Myxococcales bacterium]|nr:hypothetical protein [Myxococcales bacterium]